jgi:hypothetical protein
MVHLLFVDDSNFLFESLQDMESGAHTMHDHYAQFGLVMHVGRRDKTSNTEAMHVPAKMNQEPILEGMMTKWRGGSHIHFKTKFKYMGYKVQGNFQAE